MKVLIVASYNKGRFAPFIVEQSDAIAKQGVEVNYFGITGKGIIGYLKCFYPFIKKIKEFKPDIIHAHYGLSGLFSNLQRSIPVVTTYHGSDINNKNALRFSKIAIKLSKFNIFVSKKNIASAGVKDKCILLPCGINLDDYPITDKQEARERLGWTRDGKYVVFAGAFDNYVKNSPLAIKAISLLDNVQLIELKGYSRQQVADMFSATDALLMTSFTEGSPQVIKEAMACGCPIVSVDVGDVAEVTKNIEGCFIVKNEPNAIASTIKCTITYNARTKGRERIIELGLTNEQVVKNLIKIYTQIVS